MRGKSVVDAIRKMANWYIRRRRAVKILIFITVFIIPSMVYSYTHMPQSTTLIERYKTRLVSESENITLPKVNVYTILGGHRVYFISETEFSSIYQLNRTHYLYTYTGGYGLLIEVNATANTVFVLTDNYSTTITLNNVTYNITRITLVLPPTPPENLPPHLKTTVCAHVGNYTRYYDAFIHHTLPATYRSICERAP